MTASLAALTFDFDGMSGFIARGRTSPTMLSRGEFGAVGVERILRLLDRYGIAASFFIPGITIGTWPDHCRRIHEAGHEIGHHGWRHIPPAQLSREEEADELDRGIAAIEALTGRRPRGYRSPAWDLSENTVDLLLERGFIYDSSMMGHDTRPYRVRRGDVIHEDEASAFGEETALLESLEGKKGFPRFKPPFPANYGLWGRPTTVNNVETLALVPRILRGVRGWRVGTEKSPGTKCFSVSGHVSRPGNHELPLGTPFSDLLELCGGVWKDRELKAVIPGGSSVPVLPAKTMMELDMDFESLEAAGSLLGSGAVIVMDETTDMVRMLQRISRFYFQESCGQCTPCREGTGWLYRVLTRIVEGRGEEQDLEILEKVPDRIEGHTICALGDAAAWPVQGMLRHFRDEFEYYIRHGKSPVSPA